MYTHLRAIIEIACEYSTIICLSSRQHFQSILDPTIRTSIPHPLKTLCDQISNVYIKSFGPCVYVNVSCSLIRGIPGLSNESCFIEERNQFHSKFVWLWLHCVHPLSSVRCFVERNEPWYAMAILRRFWVKVTRNNLHSVSDGFWMQACPSFHQLEKLLKTSLTSVATSGKCGQYHLSAAAWGSRLSAFLCQIRVNSGREKEITLMDMVCIINIVTYNNYIIYIFKIEWCPTYEITIWLLILSCNHLSHQNWRVGGFRNFLCTYRKQLKSITDDLLWSSILYLHYSSLICSFFVRTQKLL